MAYVDGFVCAFGVQSLCWKSSLTVSDWAAWWQAIGTLAAVLAAVWVVWWQLAHVRDEKETEARRRLQVMWTYGYHCRVEMQYAQRLAEVNPEAFYVPNGLPHKVTAMRSIPALEFPDADVAVAVLTVVEAFDAFERGAGAQSSQVYDRRRATQTLAHANAALANFEYAERVIRRALTERGAEIPPGIYRLNGEAYPPLDAAG